MSQKTVPLKTGKLLKLTGFAIMLLTTLNMMIGIHHCNRMDDISLDNPLFLPPKSNLAHGPSIHIEENIGDRAVKNQRRLEGIRPLGSIGTGLRSKDDRPQDYHKKDNPPPSNNQEDIIHQRAIAWKNRNPSDLFPSEINSFRELMEINTDISGIPNNLHIAFAGDSLTRYQYLSLAHYLKHGKFIDPYEQPNLSKEKDFETWYDFFKHTNMKLQPEEQCDCFRPEGHKMPLMIENRSFKDDVRNNSISFFQKFGHRFTFKSNWNHSDVHNEHEFIRKEKDNHYVIDTLDWPTFITDFVAKLDPKPRYFVFNQGIHPHRDFTNQKVRRQIIRAIKENGMIGIYKTTTKYRDHDIEVNEIIEDPSVRAYEEHFCKKTDYCLDSSWTWMIPPDFYLDYAHFNATVYSWQNLQLFDLLRQLEGQSLIKTSYLF